MPSDKKHSIRNDRLDFRTDLDSGSEIIIIPRFGVERSKVRVRVRVRYSKKAKA